MCAAAVLSLHEHDLVNVEEIAEGIRPVPQFVLLPFPCDDGRVHPRIYVAVLAKLKLWRPAFNSFKPSPVKKPAILNTSA